MLRKIISLVTLISFVLFLVGCYTTKEIIKDQLPDYKDHEIKAVLTNEDIMYEFVDSKTYQKAHLADSLIVGFVMSDTYPIKVNRVEILLPEVTNIYTKKYDVARSWLLGLGIALGVVAVVVLIGVSTGGILDGGSSNNFKF